MNVLTADRAALVSELTATGVPATVDPGQVLGIITASGVCALVAPTVTYQPITYGLDFDMVVPVWLVTSEPYDSDAVERLDEALVAIWPVVHPSEPATRDTWTAADAQLPALLIPTPRHVTCQT
jgi:hypothetical protein